MNIEITKHEKKELVEREEVTALVSGTTSTPSKTQVQEKLAEKLNKSKELIIIKNIFPKFGSNENKVIAYIYNSENSLKKFEPKKKEKQVAQPAPAQ